jgi:hypothetical protein
MNSSKIYVWVSIVVLLATVASGSACQVQTFQVPEPGSTVCLFGISVAALAAGRKFLRK